MKINLLLVDDHEVVRSGLRMLLEGEKDMEIVGEAGSASEAIKFVSSLRPFGQPCIDKNHRNMAVAHFIQKIGPDIRFHNNNYGRIYFSGNLFNCKE